MLSEIPDRNHSSDRFYEKLKGYEEEILPK